MDDIFRRISETIALGLPGFPAQEEMTPPGRFPADRAVLMSNMEPRNGAVMALLNPLPGGTWSLIYIKRPDYDGTHGGQMAFPGGKADPEDEDILFTAKRETVEEIGVKENEYEMIGPLTPVYIPPSNFLVHPFLAMAKETLSFVPDDHEVEYVWQIPISDLLAKESVSTANFNTAYGVLKNYPCYIFGNHVIWGATAMITAEVKALLLKIGF
jgi:8-oxo-dGTP pyrophosphatase MutT (NUDIX family)